MTTDRHNKVFYLAAIIGPKHPATLVCGRFMSVDRDAENSTGVVSVY